MWQSLSTRTTLHVLKTAIAVVAVMVKEIFMCQLIILGYSVIAIATVFCMQYYNVLGGN